MDANTVKSTRGGYKEPRQRLTITIPNYARYQRKTKRRDWISVYKGIGRDSRIVQACERNLAPLAVFVVLLTLADDDGKIINVRPKDLALEMCGVDARTILSAIDSLANVGVIFKQPANVEQTPNNQPANVEQTTSLQSLQDKSRADAASTPATGHNKTSQGQDTNAVPPEPAPAPASASARKPVDWSDQRQKAEAWLTETLPELAAELLAYFDGNVPASSGPDQYVANRIAEVKSQAKPAKGPAPPRAALIAGWKAAMRKRAGAAYAATVMQSEIERAYDGGRTGTSTPGVAAGAGDGAEPGSCKGKQPFSIYDVDLQRR